MKTITFLAAAALMLGNAAIAKANDVPVATTMARFSFDEPIEFTERGVTFFVFANGEFDFNTVTTTAQPLYYRNGRRGNTNNTYGAPANAGVRIEHDGMGRIRRIGNVFVNYDSQNRIKRIGSVYMTYNRFALAQVGNLRILYNRRGQITGIIGNVKGQNTYQNPYGDQNQTDDDDNQIYYRNAATPADKDKKEK
jgi:hypothetical protein